MGVKLEKINKGQKDLRPYVMSGRLQTEFNLPRKKTITIKHIDGARKIKTRGLK